MGICATKKTKNENSSWTRIYNNRTSSTYAEMGENILDSQIERIDIATDEYLLLENRNNWIIDDDSIDSLRIKNKIFDNAVTAPVFPAETKPILFFDFINSIALRILLSFFDLNIEDGISLSKIISSQ